MTWFATQHELNAHAERINRYVTPEMRAYLQRALDPIREAQASARREDGDTEIAVVINHQERNHQS